MDYVEEILDKHGQSLRHYGVKGMKWGVRNTDRSSTVDVFQKRPGKRLDATGGHGLPASEDAKRAAVSKQKAKVSSVDALADNELKGLVNRMNLEQNYTRLSATEAQQRMSLGRRFTQGFLSDAGRGARVQANQAANSLASRQIEQLLKSKGLK